MVEQVVEVLSNLIPCAGGIPVSAIDTSFAALMVVSRGDLGGAFTPLPPSLQLRQDRPAYPGLKSRALSGLKLAFLGILGSQLPLVVGRRPRCGSIELDLNSGSV